MRESRELERNMGRRNKRLREEEEERELGGVEEYSAGK